MNYKYDIAISFSGENRDIAESIADKLKSNDVEVFYDKYEEADLWGKDLYQHLSKVYSEKACYCVILISEYYAEKNWTNHELKSAQERAFKENREYILPVRLDNTKLPGVPDTVGYIDLRSRSVEDVVNATLKKLGKSTINRESESGFGTKGKEVQPRIPHVRKQYSDKNKDDFLENAFSYVREYIQKGLNELENEHSNIETRFKEIDNRKFTGKIYSNGNEGQSFKIWIGGRFAENSICYSEGAISIEQDNSFNEAITIKEADNEMQLSATMGMMALGAQSDIKTQEDAAGYLWERIIRPLEI